jgi:predicted phosphodiesterase
LFYENTNHQRSSSGIRKDGIIFDNADVIVLAGDVNLGTKGIEWIKEVISDKPVIYVLGNHEYYKGSYPKTLNKIKEQQRIPMFLYLKIHM